MKSETWLDIPGYEGFYLVSDSGLVKSVSRVCSSRWPSGRPVGERVLRPDPKGRYLMVVLSKEGNKKWWAVHRLVALVFIPNPEGKPEVNHKNGNKHDATVGNLEWVTKKENHQHASKMGLKATGDRNGARKARKAGRYWGQCGSRNPQSKLDEVRVCQIRRRLEAGEKRKELACVYGVCVQTIDGIATRQTWKSVL
jgi:hypothetical protein